MNMACTENVASEEYAEFISRYPLSPQEFVTQTGTECIDFISQQFAIIYMALRDLEPLTFSSYTYAAVPKLYSLLDSTSMESSGILPASRLPALGNKGAGVIIGFVDTGIDYQNPLFRNPDGTSRILGIWDQTHGSGNVVPGNTFRSLYGTQYPRETINTALSSDDPLSVVPSTDEIGHGTFLASIAAGGEDEERDFTGAAPQADIAVVKLKPAKQYLRDFYLIRQDAQAYQENDIMMGITYLLSLARQYNKPLVICLGIGTNQGGHVGNSPLSAFLNDVSSYIGTALVVAAGNETGLGHHYRGITEPVDTIQSVELKVGENDTGFSMELWAQDVEVYRVGFTSPTGEVISPLPPRTGEENVLRFLLERTEITVYTYFSIGAAGSQMVFIRFKNPMPGIWNLSITGTLDLRGSFHIWLPSRGFISDDTFFLRPDPDTTITDPGNSQSLLTVAAYDHTNGGIYIHSSRGFNRIGQVKPDLAAPGVNIQGAGLKNTFTRMTGTSSAAAHVSGAAAILLHWGVIQKNNFFMNTSSIKTYLIRGAKRNPALTYPNREFGYGTLDLYEAFLRLRP